LFALGPPARQPVYQLLPGGRCQEHVQGFGHALADLTGALEVDLQKNGKSRGESGLEDRKSTRLNSSHASISYAVCCLKKKTQSPESRKTLAERRKGVQVIDRYRIDTLIELKEPISTHERNSKAIVMRFDEMIGSLDEQ